MYHFTLVSIILIVFSGLLVGITKTGIPGLGILVVPILAMAMSARQSTGFMLPMLCAGDLMAVIVYRRRARWGFMLRLLPFAMIGVVGGYFAMTVMSDAIFKPFLASSILLILVLDAVRRLRSRGAAPSGGKANLVLAAVTGILAGFFTMMANAAGPIMSLYLLSMNLPKEDFVGTGAWFYFFINLFKLPFSAAQGLITVETLTWTAMLIPVILAGGALGLFVLKKLSDKGFTVAIQALTAAGAIKLFF
jgi:uncharacterized protein